MGSRGRVSKETMISLALPILSLAYLLLFLQHSLFVLYGAMILMGLGMGMAYPSLAAAATTYCAPSQQATITGLITATTAMGYVIGPPLAAVIYQVNIALPFAVASVLIALTTCVVYITLQRASRRE